MKRFKKWFSLALCLALCAGLLLTPVSASTVLRITSLQSAGTETPRGEGAVLAVNKQSENIDFYEMTRFLIDGNHDLWLSGGANYYRVVDGIWLGYAVPEFKKVMENVREAQITMNDSYLITTDGTLWRLTKSLVQEAKALSGSALLHPEDLGTAALINVAAVSVTSYGSWRAAVTEDGDLYTWGSNHNGCLGDGTVSTNRLDTPQKILDGVIQVSIGETFGMAVRKDGSLWSWGSNRDGVLGNGGVGNVTENGVPAQTVPAKIMDGVFSVSCSERFAAALAKDGTLWMWGKGCLGSGVDQQSAVPVKVMENVDSICAAYENMLAITKDNRLWMWGRNYGGQLGSEDLGDSEDSFGKKYQTSPLAVFDDVYAASSWKNDTVVLKTDGTLWAWGRIWTEEGGGAAPKFKYSEPIKMLDKVVMPEAAHELAVPYRQSVTLLDATQFAPYRYAFSGGTGCSLTGGKLPAGLSLSSDGVLSGIPTELGVFSFTVATGAGAAYACRLSVLWAGGVDVEKSNEKGYGFVETATNDGRVHDQYVTSVEELKPQTMHCEGAFSEFYALYLDGRKLIRDVEYYATEGSTRNTLTDKTLADAGSGTHVLTAEFHTKKSGGGLEIKYTTQKYTITGVPGKNVNVVVKGVPVVWTDAQPYVNTDSRTMVPFRAIADVLGLTVEWDGVTREAIFTNGTKTIYFPLDSKTARTGTGGSVYMDTAAISVNGRSYAPVRYLAEFFGYTVTWDGKTRTVGIG